MLYQHWNEILKYDNGNKLKQHLNASDFRFFQIQLNNIDNKQISLEELNSGRIEGIAAVYLSEENHKATITTVEISANITAKTFARVLEFIYTGK